MNTKQLVLVAVMLIATGSLHAQGTGSAGIAEATKMVTSYFDPGTKLCYAIGAVIGLVGGVKVYNKFSSGDPRKQGGILLVRCVHLSDCRRHYPAFVLPLRDRFAYIIMYMDYELNKGIGESAEFKGLKAQYLFIFAGGLLALFVLFVILYMAGVGQWLCIAFGVTSASALVWLTFHLNGKFGEHGLMKLLARKQHPRYLINRISPRKLFTIKKKNVCGTH